MSLMEDLSAWTAPGMPWPGVAAPRYAATVTLVGAGPGDPELLTIKAWRALQAASLVLHDHLVSDAVLGLIHPAAERIYVGKQSSRHALSQTAIIELMLTLARSGRSLVRLKGGDGYIFGRGGEEAEALVRAGISFDVIPGLTAAQGAAASTGIPLTHRDHASTLIYTTGHAREGGTPALNWPLLALPRQTVVIYMGVGALPGLCRKLIEAGRAPDTPAAIVERATLPDERCLTGTLATLPELARSHGVQPPALIIVGEVVSLRQVLVHAHRAARIESGGTLGPSL